MEKYNKYVLSEIIDDVQKYLEENFSKTQLYYFHTDNRGWTFMSILSANMIIQPDWSTSLSVGGIYFSVSKVSRSMSINLNF